MGGEQGCLWCGHAVLMTTCTSRLTDRWGQWESMTPSFPAPDPCCPTSFLFLPVLEPELELPGRGAAPAQRRSRGSLLLLAPTHDPLCYCSFRFPNLVLASFPLPRAEALAWQPRDEWPRRSPRAPRLAQLGLVELGGRGSAAPALGQ